MVKMFYIVMEEMSWKNYLIVKKGFTKQYIRGINIEDTCIDWSL